MVLANNQTNLWRLISRQTEILHKLIQEALADTTFPRDRLAINKTLTEIQGKLVGNLRMNNPGTAATTLDFTGSTLRPTTSRFKTEKSNE